MTPKTILVLLTSLAAFALIGCGDNDTASIVAPVVDTVPPAVPADVHVQPLTASVEVTWAENAEPDLAGYVLQRSTDGATTWTTVNTSLLTTSSYTDYKNPTAHYRVAATDLSSNQSAYSEQQGYFRATPTPKTPAMPDQPRF